MAQTNKLEVVLSILDKATAPLNAFNKRIEAMQAPIKRLQAPLQQVSNRLALMGQASGIGRVGGAVRGVGDAFGDVASKAGTLAGGILAGAGIIGGALALVVKSSIDTMDQFDDLAQKAGVTTEAFQKMSYAARFANVDSQALAGGLGKLNQNIVAAATGSQEMQVWFKRAGISMAELKKSTPEQVFGRVMDALAKFPQESAKGGALAAALLGKQGKELVAMAGDYRALTAEAEKFGLVVSGEDAAAAAKFNDTLDKLMYLMKSIANSLVASLLPSLQMGVDLFKEWLLTNKEIIKTNILDWIAKLRENWPEIKRGALDAWAAIGQIVDLIKGAVDFVGGWGNALKIVAAVLAGPLLLSVLALTKAIFVLGTALLTTPVGWFLGAIALLAGAVFLIYKNWDKIGAFFTGIWDGVKEAFVSAGDFIRKYITDLWDWISGIFSGGIETVLSAFRGVGNFFTGNNWIRSAAAPGSSLPIGSLGPAAGVAPLAASGGPRVVNSTQTNNAKVEVDFKNVPRGTEVTPDPSNKMPVDLSMGFAMAGMGS